MYNSNLVIFNNMFLIHVDTYYILVHIYVIININIHLV